MLMVPSGTIGLSCGLAGNPTLLNSENRIRRDGFLIGNRLAQIPQSRKHRDSRFIEHLLVTNLWSGGTAPSIHHAQSGILELDA